MLFVLAAAAIVTAAVAAASIVTAAVAAASQAVDLTVGRTKDGTEPAAAFWFCGRRKHIQRETDIFEVSAGVTGNRGGGAGFRHASAQRIYHHIDSTEQFYDGKQANGNIDCNRCAHGSIAVRQGNGIAFAGRMMMVMAGIAAAAGIAQFCLQGNSLAFRNGKGPPLELPQQSYRSVAVVTSASVEPNRVTRRL